MKNRLFNIVLLISVNMIAFDLYASDQKNEVDIDVDRQIFTINGRIASPYSTKFVETLRDSFCVIESGITHTLFSNASKRMRSINCNKTEADLTLLKQLFLLADETRVMIPEKGLFTLLQYSYGIRRTETETTILFNENGTSTIKAGPLLIKVLDKYRENERIEQ